MRIFLLLLDTPNVFIAMVNKTEFIEGVLYPTQKNEYVFNVRSNFFIANLSPRKYFYIQYFFLKRAIQFNSFIFYFEFTVSN